MDQGTGAVARLAVDVDGSGTPAVAQLWDSHRKLGMTVYVRRTAGNYETAWTSTDMGQGAGAVAAVLSESKPVAVETALSSMGSGRPPHRSQRALLTHWALTSGSGEEARFGPGMRDADEGNPATDQFLHSRPVESGSLASASQRPIPVPVHFSTKCIDLAPVQGHRIVGGITAHHATQPRPLFGDRMVAPSGKLLFYFPEFRSLPLGHGSSSQLEPSCAVLPTDVGEAQEVEGLWFPFSSTLPLLRCIRSEAQQPRLVRVQRQAKSGQSFSQLAPVPLSFLLVLKSQRNVVGIARHDDLAARMSLSPLLGPLIEDVVQIDVRQQARDRRPLWHSLCRLRPAPFLQNARRKPFLDQAQHPAIRNPVLDKLHHPLVIDGSVEITNVCVEHKVHRPTRDSDRQCIQRHVRAASGPESIREPEKVHFVDCIHHLHHRALDDLVLQHSDPERTFLSVRLGDEHSSRWLCSVRSSVQPCVQVLEVFLQPLAILHPGHPVYSGCRLVRQRHVARPQSRKRDVVKQRREPRFPILPGYFSHALQLA